MSIRNITLLLSTALAVILGEVHAQKTGDTLHVTLVAVEQRFLEKNALLLAQKFNIEAAKAQIRGQRGPLHQSQIEQATQKEIE